MSGNEKEVKMQIAPTFICNVMSVKKRSGETVAFEAKKIYNAIKKAATATNEISDETVVQITNEVLSDLDNNFMARTPSVEEIQDTVIRKLMDAHVLALHLTSYLSWAKIEFWLIMVYAS